MQDEIAITGLGVMSPIGNGTEVFWEGLCTGRSGAGPVKGLDTSQLPRRIACQVRGTVDAGRPTGRAAALAVMAARQAVDAGKARQLVGTSPGCVLVGTTMGETEYIENQLGAPQAHWLSQGHLDEILSGAPGSIAEHVRDDLTARGTASDLYGACAAGNLALEAARRKLLGGTCDWVLAGGADGFSRLAFLGFMRLRVMAAEMCRPFDEQRDGLLVGEGAGFLLLERSDSARKRGAEILAVVSGASVACEDFHPTRPEPQGDGLGRAIAGALKDAGLQASEIDYVCAHGTGTPQNDAIELSVMRRCFPEGVPFSSIKSLTGHTMGAAAAIEAAACVLSLRHQTLIPTWQLRQPAACGTLQPLREGPLPGRLRHVINNSAGFGGYNSSVIISMSGTSTS